MAKTSFREARIGALKTRLENALPLEGKDGFRSRRKEILDDINDNGTTYRWDFPSYQLLIIPYALADEILDQHDVPIEKFTSTELSESAFYTLTARAARQECALEIERNHAPVAIVVERNAALDVCDRNLEQLREAAKEKRSEQSRSIMLTAWRDALSLGVAAKLTYTPDGAVTLEVKAKKDPKTEIEPS